MSEQDRRPSIHEFYREALSEKKESDSVRAQNIPLEFVRKSSEVIHYFTDNGWRSAGLTIGILTLAYLSTVADGKIVTDVAAFAGRGIRWTFSTGVGRKNSR